MSKPQGNSGGVSQHLTTTPAWKKRKKTAREREEDYWARRAGPVTVSRLCGTCKGEKRLYVPQDMDWTTCLTCGGTGRV